jgi:putative flippase GtrA
MKFNFKIPKFIRFALVGVVNTLIDLGILNLLIFIFGVVQPLSFSIFKGISFVCALVNSYFMNKNFTFESKENSPKTFSLFVFYSLIGFLVNVASSSFMFSFLEGSQLDLNTHILATISGIFGTVLGLAVNYISYNFLVFK